MCNNGRNLVKGNQVLWQELHHQKGEELAGYHISFADVNAYCSLNVTL